MTWPIQTHRVSAVVLGDSHIGHLQQWQSRVGRIEERRGIIEDVDLGALRVQAHTFQGVGVSLQYRHVLRQQ